MNNYSVFDAHCDTLCYVVDKGGNVACAAHVFATSNAKNTTQKPHCQTVR